MMHPRWIPHQDQRARAALAQARYRLLDRLHAGTVSEVLRANAVGIESFVRRCVVKRLWPGVAEIPELVERFAEQAKRTAQLEHANVVKVLDLLRIDRRLSTVMELVAGKDLKAMMAYCRATERPMPPVLACFIVMQVADALDHVHARGLIHGNLSPAHVLVSFEGEVKLTDFGFSCRPGHPVGTRLVVARGQPGYRSPEQQAGQPLDRRTDVFSLGVLMYELFSGAPVFSVRADMQKLRESGLVLAPPSARNRGLPHELDPVAMTALAMDPRHRPQSAGELAQGLEDFALAAGRDCSREALSAWMCNAFAEEFERMAYGFREFRAVSS
ncbi:MAG TPA: serine/threonine-protein kinase [Polyangia bacterium]|nr:serine/threonine-protein kinase [Polyangia bacterium]